MPKFEYSMGIRNFCHYEHNTIENVDKIIEMRYIGRIGDIEIR